jgi:xanthine dehydrogenase accessory factor
VNAWSNGGSDPGSAHWSAHWSGVALARIAGGEACALVTLLAVEGSAPREAGTKMLVWAAGQWGSIGGGNLEHQAARQARRMLALGEAPRLAVQDYPLGPLLAQCCGGRVRLMIERLDEASCDWLTEAERYARGELPFELRTQITEDGAVKAVGPDGCTAPCVTLGGAAVSARGERPGVGAEIIECTGPSRPVVLLFGAGHVGQAVHRALEPLPFRVFWYDSREELAGRLGLAVLPADVQAEIAGDGAPYSLVLTHDHALDFALVQAALTGSGAGYVGLIGSLTKRARFFSRLRAAGVGEAALARLHCPIGIPGLKSKAPEVIAVSVAADLLLRLEASRRTPALEPALASL